MTREQQQAIAIAEAKMRMAQSEAGQSQVQQAQVASQASNYRPPVVGMAGVSVPVQISPGMVKEFLASTALEGGGAAVGQMVGAAGGPAAPVTVPIGGAVGGSLGYVANQFRKGESPTLGGIASAATLGAVPGGSLAGAPAKTVAKEALKQVAAAEVAAAAKTLLDEKRLPTVSEAGLVAATAALGTAAARGVDTSSRVSKAELAKINNAVEDETIKIAQNAGYRIIPSRVKNSKVAAALEYLGGKDATAAEMAITNANVTLGLIRKELGLDPKEVIDLDSIARVKAQAGFVYEKAANISPSAKSAVEDYKRFKEYANSYWHDANSPMAGNRADSRIKAKEYDAKADAEWAKIEAEARRVGMATGHAGVPEIMNELTQAKRLYAKASLVEQAFNEGSGKISADIISKAAKNRGQLLDGELEVIHRVASAFPQTMGETERKAGAGIVFNRLTTLAAIGATGYYTNVPTAAALTGLAAITPSAARSALMSDMGQKMLTTRFYDPAIKQDLAAKVVQMGSSMQGQPQTQPKAATLEELQRIRGY